MKEGDNLISFVPRRVRQDVTEAIEKARIKDMDDICRSVVCGCRGCMQSARQAKEFWDYKKLPDRREAKEVIAIIKDYEGKA